jgi:UDP-GlcNAc:undecaprenyl-phosphate/decaprenyl-phosphate GlcNAc-1-phosphate transferase
MRFHFAPLLSAFGAAVVLTWLVRKAAHRLGVLDCPDGVRKLHRAPIPLLGGVGVFGAWIVGVAAGSLFISPETPTATESSVSVSGGFGPSLYLAAAVVLATGILDDVLTLRPRWKLLGQTIAATILVSGGLMVKSLWLFGFSVELGWLGVVFSIVWLVGSMNSINMLDGLDGLASTLGVVIALTLAWMAWLSGNPSLGLISLALAGALAGFLVFNFPPASIYLGDSGSMLIGLLIGAVAIKGSFKAPATAALAAPLAVLALPICDGIEVVIRRRIKGLSISAPDRNHIHHSLQRFGLSSRQILVAICALCATTGAAVLLSLYFRNEPIALAATLAVAVGCAATKLIANRERRQDLPATTLPFPQESETPERKAA